jgi:FtsZ-binding cell division protein ZapB
MERGDQFPPVDLFHDGVHYYLADGFHRYFALKKLKRHGVEASVISGTLTDAVLYALKANNKHGKRRTTEDKTNAVKICLNHIEWSTFSTTKIAEMCDVSVPFVAKLRRGEEPETIKYVDKDGKLRERTNPSKNVSKVDKKSDEKDEAPETFRVPVDNSSANPVQLESAHEAIDMLSNTVKELEDKLAGKLATDPDFTANHIKELNEKVQQLEIELDAVKKSRDSYQNQNAELMKQIRFWEKKVKKLEGK